MINIPAGVRPVIDELIAQLRRQLNTNVEIVYQEINDRTINMEHIPSSRYYISEAVEPLQPPAIFVVANESVENLEWQQTRTQTHSISVAIVVEDIEAQRLVKKVRAYAAALWLTLHDYRTGEPNIYVKVLSTNYGAIFVKGAVGQRSYRKDVTLQLEVLHVEAFQLA